VTEAELDQLCVNTIRTLSIDAVQVADPAIRERRWRSRRPTVRLRSDKIVAAARAQLGRASP